MKIRVQKKYLIVVFIVLALMIAGGLAICKKDVCVSSKDINVIAILGIFLSLGFFKKEGSVKEVDIFRTYVEKNGAVLGLILYLFPVYLLGLLLEGLFPNNEVLRNTIAIFVILYIFLSWLFMVWTGLVFLNKKKPEVK